MKEWVQVLKAADAAARWHVHQRRKGPAEEPYINHLLEVATLVAEATDATNPNLVIAALLHDAIEDQEVPAKMISELFGDEVCGWVQELTDDKTLPKNERKEKQVATASAKTEGAKLIKIADKISNLRSIAGSPPANWSVRRRLEYVGWARNVVGGMRGTSDRLERAFDEAAAAAEQSVVAGASRDLQYR